MSLELEERAIPMTKKVNTLVDKADDIIKAAGNKGINEFSKEMIKLRISRDITHAEYLEKILENLNVPIPLHISEAIKLQNEKRKELNTKKLPNDIAMQIEDEANKKYPTLADDLYHNSKTPS